MEKEFYLTGFTEIMGKINQECKDAPKNRDCTIEEVKSILGILASKVKEDTNPFYKHFVIIAEFRRINQSGGIQKSLSVYGDQIYKAFQNSEFEVIINSGSYSPKSKDQMVTFNIQAWKPPIKEKNGKDTDRSKRCEI